MIRFADALLINVLSTKWAILNWSSGNGGVANHEGLREDGCRGIIESEGRYTTLGGHVVEAGGTLLDGLCSDTLRVTEIIYF